MNRIPLVLAVCATLALAGCSGGSKPLTAAKAKSLAALGVLTAADLPGYTAEAQTHDASDDATDAALSSCLGVAAPTYLARDFGKAFTKGEVEVDSSADVAPSAAAATTVLHALTSSKGPGCMKKVLTDLLATSGLTVSNFSATPQTATVPGSDAAFGYEFSFMGKSGGSAIAFHGFEAGTLVGQVEVDVTVIAAAGSGYTFDQAVALLTTATGRVRAAL